MMRADRLRRGDIRKGKVYWQSSRKGTPLFVTPEEFADRQVRKSIGRALSVERLAYSRRIAEVMSPEQVQGFINLLTAQAMSVRSVL